MKESDQAATAFITPYGPFYFNTMPFGLKNAGATYQCMIQTCLEKQIGKSSVLDIDSIGDFQCDQTHGFPTFLNIHWNSGTTWLSLNYRLVDEDTDISEYEQGCADWGIRDCDSIEKLNTFLESLGEDAYGYALPIEEEIQQSM